MDRVFRHECVFSGRKSLAQREGHAAVGVTDVSDEIAYVFRIPKQLPIGWIDHAVDPRGTTGGGGRQRQMHNQLTDFANR